MAVNQNMLIAYLANARSDPVIQRADSISRAAQAAGDDQLSWAKGEADKISGLGTRLIEQGDQATQWGNEQATGLTNDANAVRGYADTMVGDAGTMRGDAGTMRGDADTMRGDAGTLRTQAGVLTGQATSAFSRFNSTYVPIELQSAIDSVAGVYADDNTFDTLATRYAEGITDPAQREQTIATLKAQRGAQKAGAEQAAGTAAGDIAKAYASKTADTNRVLSQRGVSADKLAALTRMTDIQQAADTASASNSARDSTLRAGVEDRLKQIGIGRQLLDQGGQFTMQSGALTGQAADVTNRAADVTNRAGVLTGQAGDLTGRAAGVRGQAGNLVTQAANVRTAGLPFYSAGAGATESASRVRTSPQSWYGLSLQGANTQLGASQVGIDALNTAQANQAKIEAAKKAEGASLWGGLGSLAGTAIGAYFGGPVGASVGSQIGGKLGSSVGS